MFLDVIKSIDDNYICENVNKTKNDFIKIFPPEIVLEIFSHLNLATLGTICCVSKAWKRLANEPKLWKTAIYREIAFGNHKWAQCFGTDVVKDEDNREELSSLPLNDFIADCKKFKSIFPKRSVKDRLMLVRLPKTLNGGLTLKSLGELAKKHFPKSNTGYRFIKETVMEELGDQSIDKSQWVLMTKDVLPGSRSKCYHRDQERVINALAKKSLINYKIPTTLEAAACILSQYFGSKNRLFNDDPIDIRLFSDDSWTDIRLFNDPLNDTHLFSDDSRTDIRLFSDDPLTYTRCQDNKVMIGSFTEDGLIIYPCSDFNQGDQLGVAVLRKF